MAVARSAVPVYYINMRTSEKRNVHIRSLLSRHFKHVHRVEAVTKAVAKSGRSLANTLVEEQSLRILRSHVRAVRTAYDAGDPFVVVMEDDVCEHGLLSILAAFHSRCVHIDIATGLVGSPARVHRHERDKRDRRGRLPQLLPRDYFTTSQKSPAAVAQCEHLQQGRLHT
jgi:hypothetical protein